MGGPDRRHASVASGTLSGVNLDATIRKLKPTRIVAYLDDDSTRELRPTPGTRKRWEQPLATLRELHPVAVECYGAADELLGRVELDGAELGAVADPPPDLTDSADRYLSRLVQAQREALTWQDRSVRAALDACVAVMGQLGAAVASISRAHEYERDQLRGLVAEARASANEAPAPDANSQILAQLAPLLASKLLSPPSSAPAPHANGAPKAKPPGA